MIRRTMILAVILAALGAGLTGCSKARGGTPEEKRDYTRQMASDRLNELYERKPETREMVENAAGYGVFSNLSSQAFLFLSTGNGYGIVVENGSGQETFMRMSELGAGLGIGITDYYVVMIFHEQSAMDEFIRGEFQWKGEADATAKAGDTGGSAQGDTTDQQRITTYEWADKGLQLGASFKGAQFKVDQNLTVGDG